MNHLADEYELIDSAGWLLQVRHRKKLVDLDKRRKHMEEEFIDNRDSRHAYVARLAKLAKKRNIGKDTLKQLIEDAFGSPTGGEPDQQEVEKALQKLADMKIGVRDLNKLFGYTILPERGRHADTRNA